MTKVFSAHAASVGGGTLFFQALPARARLRRLTVLEAPGVTHLTSSVLR